MKLIKVYEPGDLLTTDDVADHFGYSRDHVRNMLDIQNKVADPRLIRLKIGTDREWRKANSSRAMYVFEYSAVKAWYVQRQRRAAVKSSATSRRGTPNPIL